MKIRFWDRIILLIGAAIAFLVGAALFFGGLRRGEDMSALHRTLTVLFGAVVATFGGYLVFFPRRYSMQHGEYVTQRTDTGELRIAVKAIENLVEKCVDLHEEIQLLSMSVTNTREGVVVELFISLANNISIPLAVASLQKQIKQYLVASSGIEVREVRVIVENTKDEPLLVAEIEEEEENEPEKAPMHQRLFCQAEQATIVPTPPTPADTEADQAVPAPDPSSGDLHTEEQKDEQ